MVQIPLGVLLSILVGVFVALADRRYGDPGEFAGFCVTMAGLYLVYRVHRYWHWRWFAVGAIGIPVLIGMGVFVYVMMMLGKMAAGMGR